MSSRVHWRRSVSVLAMFGLVASGCTERRTRVDIEIPESIESSLTAIDLFVFEGTGKPPGMGELCFDVLDWGRASCGESCSAVEPFAPSTDPFFESRLLRKEGGGFDRVKVDVPDGTSWSLLVVGMVGEQRRVFGCERVDAGLDGSMIELWYPLCEAAASCSGRYHPGCLASVDCAALPPPTEVDESTLLAPPCAIGAIVDDDEMALAWAEDGVVCPPDPPATFWAGTCQQELISCAEGAFEAGTSIVTAGTCPALMSDEPCVGVGTNGNYSPADDFDCDFQHPVCMTGICSPGETDTCGSLSGCTGVTTCRSDGTWSDCRFGNASERCNALDDDCDDAVDEGSEAVDACNAGFSAVTPIANRCASGTCLCGSAPACGDGQACCGAECVDTLNNDEHCGGCDRECQDPARCVAGACTTDMDDGGMAECSRLEACNVTWARADECTGGNCLCNGGPACEQGDREQCCNGACVDVLTSLLHCGGCDRRCTGVCQGGSCIE